MQLDPVEAARIARTSALSAAWKDGLRTAERAARAGGSHLVANRSQLALAFLSRRTPLQQLASIAESAQDLMRDEIRRRYPGHVVIGRAELATASEWNRGPVWLINALDGATAYLADKAGWAVTLALLIDGRVRLGVVVDLVGGRVYRAMAGSGADRLAVQGVASPDLAPQARLVPSSRQHLADSRAWTQFPLPGSPTMATFSREFGRASVGFRSIARHPSVSLAMAEVAAGEADAFWCHHPVPCDTAAATLLLSEAGASVRARDGRPLLESTSITACAPGLAYDFHALLAGL